MSWGTPEAGKAWADAQKFGFEIWSDTGKALSTHYGAAGFKPFPSRITMLLGRDGELLLEYKDGIDVGTHPADVLADIKALFPK